MERQEEKFSMITMIPSFFEGIYKIIIFHTLCSVPVRNPKPALLVLTPPGNRTGALQSRRMRRTDLKTFGK